MAQNAHENHRFSASAEDRLAPANTLLQLIIIAISSRRDFYCEWL
jgi:hypothetical protein